MKIEAYYIPAPWGMRGSGHWRRVDTSRPVSRKDLMASGWTREELYAREVVVQNDEDRYGPIDYPDDD